MDTYLVFIGYHMDEITCTLVYHASMGSLAHLPPRHLDPLPSPSDTFWQTLGTMFGWAIAVGIHTPGAIQHWSLVRQKDVKSSVTLVGMREACMM